MPTWFAHVEAAAAHAGVTPRYLFVCDRDDETYPILQGAAGTPRDVFTVPVKECEPYEERDWHRAQRLRHMVQLRNTLLGMVRDVAPDVFLSVDSDILLAPEAIADLLESLDGDQYQAVGGGTFMSPPEQGPGLHAVQGRGERFPSCGWVSGNDGLRREYMAHRGLHPVGVIMAVKAMSPTAYAVRYTYASAGEDIGWSVAAARAGLRLGWDNRHPSKHVMRRDDLDRVDERCGF